MAKKKLWRRLLRILVSKLFIGIVIGVVVVFISHSFLEYTSSDDFCGFCHVHPHSTENWKKSVHYINESGIRVHCVQCHLPPKGFYKYSEKIRVGLRDVWGTIFKDVSKINWEIRSRVENARTYTYDAACTHCHAELFSLNLTKKGEDAHVYYYHRTDQLRCINCHLTVGHFHEKPLETILPYEETAIKKPPQKPLQPVPIDTFKNYIDFIPGTHVTFEMIAVPGGTFQMGSSESEDFRQANEGPQHSLTVDSFWLGKTEVTWDEWQIFYAETATMGKQEAAVASTNLDVITGPTPPYGDVGQGWGRGARPAITMTHHAAMTYCQWLSQKTGFKYRLPTEAEWEYAVRGGTTGAYFFKGQPGDYSKKAFLNKIFGADTTTINQYVWFEANSNLQTQPVDTKTPNPFGLVNMLGNVKEFCLDWYSPETYFARAAGGVVENPRGPTAGEEHVIRGGSFRSDPADLRVAARDYTRSEAWFLSDPQSPKSIWWYSDCNDVGFRVVREYQPK